VGLLVLIALTSCSLVRFAYSNLDWFALRYVNQFLDLNDTQEAAFSSRFTPVWKQHRRDGLPRLIAALRAAETMTGDGLSRDEIENIQTRAITLYDDTATQVIPLLGPTLTTLSPDQVKHLRGTIDDGNEEFADKFGLGKPAAQRAELRAERMADRLEDWIGPLEHEQYVLLDAIASEWPDFVEQWQEYRTQQQVTLFSLLGRGASATELRALFEEWWVHQVGMGESSYLRSAQVRALVRDTLFRISETFTPEQREALIERIRSLRLDFEAALAQN
jgi:hypothetical protein